MREGGVIGGVALCGVRMGTWVAEVMRLLGKRLEGRAEDGPTEGSSSHSAAACAVVAKPSSVAEAELP